MALSEHLKCLWSCRLWPVWDRDGVEAGGPGVGEHGVGDPDPVHHPPVQVQRADRAQPGLREPEPRVSPGLAEVDVKHKVVIDTILRRGHGSWTHLEVFF